MQCLDTIGSILEVDINGVILISNSVISEHPICYFTSQAVEQIPEVLASLEPIVHPMLLKLLMEGEELYEYIDSAVQMISEFTYYSDSISSHMWSLCGPLLLVLCDWAIDYIAEIMVPVLNYICKDTVNFLQGSHEGQPFVVMMLNVVEKIFESDE